MAELLNGSTSLDLEGKGLGRTEMAIAAQILRRNHTLRTLKISDNSMGRHGLMALTDALVNARPPLQEVHMGNLGITSGEEIRAFLRALRAGGAPLRVLDLHSNPLCSPLPAPYAGAEEPSSKELAYISPISRLYLAYISPISPLNLQARRSRAARSSPRSCRWRWRRWRSCAHGSLLRATSWRGSTCATPC